MSAVFSSIGADHAAARNLGSISFADSGAANSSIEVFDATGAKLVTLTLAKPCGALNSSGKIVLAQKDSGGDLIVLSGQAATASWISGDGRLVAAGAVTDQSGEGPFILQGSGGASSTQLYAGGRAYLGATELG